MATLSGNKVKDTYTSLLKLESNGVTSTLKTVEDGAGVDSALKLSTDTLEVDGTLSFTTAPTTDSAELTCLLIDSSNNVVKRELDSVAFSGSSSQVFSNPMYVLRPNGSYTFTTTSATPTQSAVSNTNNTSSHIVNDSSNVHLQTSSTTTGAVTIESQGLIRIDVNIMIEVTTAGEFSVSVKEKPSGGSAAVIQTIKRNLGTGNREFAFSLFRYAATDTDIYYEVFRNSAGAGAMLVTSTFAITKLD